VLYRYLFGTAFFKSSDTGVIISTTYIRKSAFTVELGFNHKCGYCQSVCPAGTAGISPYLADKKGYVQEVVKPLKERPEPVYVVGGSQTETRVKGNPYKEIRYAKVTR
jgi:ferredoxin